MSRPLFSLFCLLLLGFVSFHSSPAAEAQEWSRFRGPNGSGESEAATIPITWTTKDYNWRVALPGTGHSSPVVWGNRVYVTSTHEDDATRIVSCLDTADGKTVWQQSFSSKTYRKNGLTSYASATPPVDAERIYLTWTTPEAYNAVALDRQSGKEVWRRDLGPFAAQHGFGASPILSGGMLIVPNDQDEKSFVIALDGQTGKTVWQAERRTEKMGASYSTPCIYQPEGGSPQLILSSRAHGINALDPQTGKTIWELTLFEKRVVGSPMLAAGLIIAGCGEGQGGKRFVAVQPGNPAKGIEAKMVYEFPTPLPYVPTPVAYGHWVFLWSEQGLVTCADAPTGKIHWQEKVGGKFYCSPIRVRDCIYCISREGEMVVLAAAEKYKLLARVNLEESSDSTPAVAGGVMYLRTLSHLMALGGKKG
jgi:outer membrane protein assembly factor BamB